VLGTLPAPRRRGRALSPTLVEGAKAVQLADLAYKSMAEQRWMVVPELKL